MPLGSTTCDTKPLISFLLAADVVVAGFASVIWPRSATTPDFVGALVGVAVDALTHSSRAATTSGTNVLIGVRWCLFASSWVLSAGC